MYKWQILQRDEVQVQMKSGAYMQSFLLEKKRGTFWAVLAAISIAIYEWEKTVLMTTKEIH